MKSLMATLTVAVLVGAQPLSGQIGQEIGNPQGRAAPRAQEPRADRPQEHRHTVRRGDTLWDLAGQYYGNPFFWPTIHDANRGVVEDPHWIYPEEVLVIPGVPTAIAEGPPGDPGEIRPVQPLPVEPSTAHRTRFYRENEVGGPLLGGDDGVQRDAVRPGEYYTAPWISRLNDLPVLGSVRQVVDAPPGDEEQDLMVHPFDDVYVEYRGATVRPPVGTRLMVVTVGREFDDGADEFVIQPAGLLVVRDAGVDVMTARVTEQWGPFARNARVIPLEPFPGTTGAPAPIVDGPVGRVTGFAIEQPLYADTDYGFLDLNQSQVRIGDVVLISRVQRDRRNAMPSEPVAIVKVVRVGPNGSTFRVMNAMQRRLEPGLEARVVRRIP